MQNNRPKRPERPGIMATQWHLDFGFSHLVFLIDQFTIGGVTTTTKGDKHYANQLP
jgi:hypothetical protein